MSIELICGSMPILYMGKWIVRGSTELICVHMGPDQHRARTSTSFACRLEPMSQSQPARLDWEEGELARSDEEEGEPTRSYQKEGEFRLSPISPASLNQSRRNEGKFFSSRPPHRIFRQALSQHGWHEGFVLWLPLLENGPWEPVGNGLRHWFSNRFSPTEINSLVLGHQVFNPMPVPMTFSLFFQIHFCLLYLLLFILL